MVPSPSSPSEAAVRGALAPLLSLGAAAPAKSAGASSGGGRKRRRGRPAGAKRAGRPAKSAPAKSATAAKPARRKRSKASPKLKALRALQGRYMGAVRHLSATQKAQVKKVRAESGYDAALKLAGSLGSQS